MSLAKLATTPAYFGAAVVIAASAFAGSTPALALSNDFIAVQDVTIDENHTNTNQGGTNANLFVGPGNASNKPKWALIEFNLSTIACGSTIDSASFKLNMTAAPNYDPPPAGGPLTYLDRNYQLSFWDTDGWLEGTATWTTTIGANNVLNNLGTVATGTVPALLTWNPAALKTAIQGQLANPDCTNDPTNQKKLSFIVGDSANNSNDPTATFTSKDTATQDPKPTLSLEWTEPVAGGGCDGPDLSITKYNLTPASESSPGADEVMVEFELAACTDLSYVKAQGGLGGNLTKEVEVASGGETGWPTGTDICQVVGHGKGQNQVCKWVFPTGMNDGDVEDLDITLGGTLNYGNKPACGYRPITGVWSAMGVKVSDGSIVDGGTTGQLVVWIDCILP